MKEDVNHSKEGDAREHHQNAAYAEPRNEQHRRKERPCDGAKIVHGIDIRCCDVCALV